MEYKIDSCTTLNNRLCTKHEASIKWYKIFMIAHFCSLKWISYQIWFDKKEVQR